MIKILVIGRNADITETVLRLCNSQPEWQATGALTDEEAKQKFSNDVFDVVLVGGGVSEESETLLSIEFRKSNQDIKIVRHFGGGSGLLFAEIMEAMKKQE